MRPAADASVMARKTSNAWNLIFTPSTRPSGAALTRWLIAPSTLPLDTLMQTKRAVFGSTPSRISIRRQKKDGHA